MSLIDSYLKILEMWVLKHKRRVRTPPGHTKELTLVMKSSIKYDFENRMSTKKTEKIPGNEGDLFVSIHYIYLNASSNKKT